MQNAKPDETQRPKPPLNHLRSLLETPESQKLVSLFTGIKVTRMKKWFDPDSKTLPKGDDMVKLASFFGCSVDYLLDLTE